MRSQSLSISHSLSMVLMCMLLLGGLVSRAQADDSRVIGGERKQGHLDLAFSADGEWLAAAGGQRGSQRGHVAIWSVKTGEELSWHWDFPIQCASIRFSPDGKLLAVACGDRSIHLFRQEQKNDRPTWQRLTRLPRQRLPGDKLIIPDIVRFSPDGQRLFASAYSSITGTRDRSLGIQVWNTRSLILEQTLTPPSGMVYDMQPLDRTGNRLLVAANWTPPFIVDVSSGRVEQEFFPPATGRSNSVESVYDLDVTTGFDRIAICSRSLLGIVDPNTLQIVQQIKAEYSEAPWWGVKFSPDGRLLATFSHDKFQLWDAESFELLSEQDVDLIRWVEFSPDGTTLATCGMVFEGKQGHSEVRLWDVQQLLKE